MYIEDDEQGTQEPNSALFESVNIPPPTNIPQDTNYLPRKKQSPFIPVLLMIIIFASVFILFVGPKFLDFHLIPFDPFGFSPADDEEEIIPIEKISMLINDTILLERKYYSYHGMQNHHYYKAKPDELVHFRAMLSPVETEEFVSTEWVFGRLFVGGILYENPFDALVDVGPAGSTDVVFYAYYGEGAEREEYAFRVNILIGSNPYGNEPNPPFEVDVLVTNQEKLGIFIRSEPEVTGESSKLNDGNKIGWIKGGNTDVELLATGKKHREGDNGFWWFEVMIPQSFRDTKQQTENFDGKPLVGWVREDVVKQIR